MNTIVIPVEFKENKGGVAQSSISLAQGLANCGLFQVIILCPYNSEISKVSFQGNVHVISSKASDWKISKKHFFSSLCTAWELYLKLRKYLNNNTIFLSNHSGSSYMVSLLPILNKKEIYVNRGGTLSSNGFGDKLIRFKLRHNLFIHTIAISSCQRDVLRSAGNKDENVTIIHNGLPLPNINYKFHALNPSCLWISTMGYISSTKNQHIGVELIKLLQDKGVDAKLNIYGTSCGEEVYEEELQKKVEAYGLQEKVFYRGFVKGESLFQNSDIIISFSRSEGFGRSLVEGMLRKIPVIAFRGAGGPVDILNNGEYGYLVDKNEAEQYFEKIMYMLNLPEGNRINVEKSYSYALNMFTEAVMIHNYQTLLSNLFRNK